MASFNRVIIMGHVVRDPEMKEFESGTVTNFSVAINEKWTDKTTGEQKESVNFVDCEAWGRQAEIAEEYLTQGDPVFVEGSLKQDRWEEDDGSKRSRIRIRVQRLQLMGGRNSDEDTPQASRQSSPPPTRRRDDGDDIPF